MVPVSLLSDIEVLKSVLVGAQHEKNSVEKKPVSLLVVSLGTALNGHLLWWGSNIVTSGFLKNKNRLVLCRYQTVVQFMIELA